MTVRPIACPVCMMHRDPDCDSIVDGVHADARRALRGGDRG